MSSSCSCRSFRIGDWVRIRMRRTDPGIEEGVETAYQGRVSAVQIDNDTGEVEKVTVVFTRDVITADFDRSEFENLERIDFDD